MRRLVSDEDGQTRMVEAVLAGVIVFVALFAFSAMLPPRTEAIEVSGGDIASTAYNVLQCLADSGALERAALSAEPRWRVNLRVALDEMGLSSYRYNLSVYRALSSNPFSSSLVQLCEIGNVPPGESPANSLKTVSVICPYTTSRGHILVAVLTVSGST